MEEREAERKTLLAERKTLLEKLNPEGDEASEELQNAASGIRKRSTPPPPLHPSPFSLSDSL